MHLAAVRMAGVVLRRHLSTLLLLLLLQPGWPPTGASTSTEAVAASAVRGCPGGCTCKWRDGKETTACVDLGLDSIPAGVAPNTQVLDLRRNPGVRALEGGVFVRLGITNLQRIYLQDCAVSEVQGGAFDRLTNLVELDLSGNRLREVPSEAWSPKMALMRLKMAR